MMQNEFEKAESDYFKSINSGVKLMIFVVGFGLILLLCMSYVLATSYDWVRPISSNDNFSSITLNGSTIYNWNSLNITQSEFWYNNSGKVSTLGSLPVDVDNYVNTNELRADTIKTTSASSSFGEEYCSILGLIGSSCEGVSIGLGSYVNTKGTNNLAFGTKILINESVSGSTVISSGTRSSSVHAKTNYATYILASGDNSGNNPTISIGDETPVTNRINIDRTNFGGLLFTGLDEYDDDDNVVFVLDKNNDAHYSTNLTLTEADVDNFYANSITLNDSTINDWSEISVPSYWQTGTAVNSIWRNGSYVGINKDPTVTLDVAGEIKSNTKVTTQKFYSVGEAGFHRDYVNSVAVSIKPYLSSGQGALRIYNYLNSKYAEIGLGLSGSSDVLSIWVDNNLQLSIDDDTGTYGISTFTTDLTSRRYYTQGNDYYAGINSRNIGLGYTTVACRRGELSITPAYYTYLIETDGANCIVTLDDIGTAQIEQHAFNLKNIDSTYNLSIITKASDETIDYTWNSTYGYNMQPLDAVMLHTTRDHYIIIGEVN